MGSSAVPLAVMRKWLAYVPSAIVMTSPGCAALSAAASDAASETLRGVGWAGSPGTDRVVAVTASVVSTGPSGSVACSSTSYVVPGDRSKMLPANCSGTVRPTTLSRCTRKRGMAACHSVVVAAR